MVFNRGLNLQQGQSTVAPGAALGTLTPYGGTGPFSYDFVSGDGSTHNNSFVIDAALTPAALKVSGAALSAGTYAIRVQVSDSKNKKLVKNFSFTVLAPSGSGTGGISIGINDQGQGIISQNTFTITRGATNSGDIQRLYVDGWDASPQPKWNVDGGFLVFYGNSIVLDAAGSAAGLSAGGHTLEIIAYKNGKPWSKTIPFTVAIQE
jgi:hypothetical protein